ncbi:hypothetical protein CMV_002666 [Castanea mollissima]|uniref:Uncharacterized protein n=1 Tax=Castanea mollissima TaxID=60419 RepID=A0A8J4RIM0_9ROSI|nr:hypothetical protein CMV_002666 [Castanea mollissima]
MERNVILGDSAINNSIINGRPTRAFSYKLTTATLALRIFKLEGGKRCVSWMGPNDRGLNNEGGLGACIVLNESQGLDGACNVSWMGPNNRGLDKEAKPVSNSVIGKAHFTISKDPEGKGLSASCPSDVSLGFDSRDRLVGESSRVVGRVSMGAMDDSMADKWIEMRRDMSKMLPDSIMTQSSAGIDSEPSIRVNIHGFNSEVISVLAGMEALIRSLNNDDAQVLYWHPWVV